MLRYLETSKILPRMKKMEIYKISICLVKKWIKVIFQNFLLTYLAIPLRKIKIKKKQLRNRKSYNTRKSLIWQKRLRRPKQSDPKNSHVFHLFSLRNLLPWSKSPLRLMITLRRFQTPKSSCKRNKRRSPELRQWKNWRSRRPKTMRKNRLKPCLS